MGGMHGLQCRLGRLDSCPSITVCPTLGYILTNDYIKEDTLAFSSLRLGSSLPFAPSEGRREAWFPIVSLKPSSWEVARCRVRPGNVFCHVSQLRRGRMLFRLLVIFTISLPTAGSSTRMEP